VPSACYGTTERAYYFVSPNDRLALGVQLERPTDLCSLVFVDDELATIAIVSETKRCQAARQAGDRRQEDAQSHFTPISSVWPNVRICRASSIIGRCWLSEVLVMRDHKKLRAFELADELVLSIYRLTSGFPTQEQYGLTSQLRRAAVSIASNIVECSARNGLADYIRFLDMSYESCSEIEY